MTTTALSTATGRTPNRSRKRALWVACGAHALHDGLTDTLYLLLPILQTEFALTYAAEGSCVRFMPAQWRACRSRQPSWRRG
jgi:hypothetical protein